jgi:hypothetical protein
VPSGTFDRARAIEAAGWTDISHQYEQVLKKVDIVRREKNPLAPRKPKDPNKKPEVSKSKPEEIEYEEEQIAPNDHVLMLKVWPEDRNAADQAVDPVLDYPAAAVLSPAIPIRANNLVRISLLVRRPSDSPAGKGGIIVRDSIGGEPFQYRSSGTIAAYSRVVLYRKALADGSFRVMLGLAGYGEAYFDDFRVQVIEEGWPDRDVPLDPGLVHRPRPDPSVPGLPDPRQPAAAAAAAPSIPRRQ